MADLPNHRREQTGNALLDRIQDNVRDLIEYIRGLRATERLATLESRAYAALAADTTILAAAYATLLTARITTVLASGYLVITFSACALKTTAAGYVSFQIVLDGAVVKGAYVTTPAAGTGFNVSMVVRAPVKKGAHVVLLQWKTSTSAAQINAATVVEEHAHLLVQEAA